MDRHVLPWGLRMIDRKLLPYGVVVDFHKVCGTRGKKIASTVSAARVVKNGANKGGEERGKGKLKSVVSIPRK